MSDLGAEVRHWPPKLPWRVRLAKLLCPRGFGVVKEVGFDDIRV